MNLKFEVNDYVLAWNLLYKSSITKNIIDAKKRIWKNYKNSYNKLYKEKELMIEDPRNFIPDNDTVYNIIKENEDYDIVKKETEKYRISLMKIWDKERKKINYLVNDILRLKLRNYSCSVIHKKFNLSELILIDDSRARIILGKEYNDENDYLIDLFFKIVKSEISIKEKDELGIKDAIIEMAVLNEFATQIKKASCYKIGNQNLFQIKKQIYPYWLMYLGIKKEDMVKYMIRDKIVFDAKHYAYEKELINMNIEEFIEFIIRNQRYIIRDKKY